MSGQVVVDEPAVSSSDSEISPEINTAADLAKLQTEGRPLTSLLKGSKDGRKSGDFSKAWGSLQHRLFWTFRTFQTVSLLRHYNPKLLIHLETDVSDVVLEGVLS